MQYTYTPTLTCGEKGLGMNTYALGHGAHTLFGRSKSDFAFTSATTTSVLPFLAAHISAEFPYCVMTTCAI